MKYKYNLINLNDLNSYNNEAIKTFLRFNGIEKFEDCDIIALKKIIPKINKENRKHFNVSYVIDRLDKEFDLIKMDSETIINIELKSSYCDIEQCMENYRLLKKEYKESNVIIFCYESTNNHLLVLNYKDEKFIKTDFEYLNQELTKIKNGKKVDININISAIYTNPNIYLENKYSLSSSQQTAKKRIIDSDKKINVISGRAGSGKSLLALDIYRYYNNLGMSVQFLAPFKINDIVDSNLITAVGIKTVRDFRKIEETKDICIIDEAQRLKQIDLNQLKEKTTSKLILLGDINQNIDSEQTFNKLYEDRVNNFVHTMNQVIRSDDTFDYFARKILNKSDKIKKKKYDKNKISIEMYDEEKLMDDLKDYVFIEPSKSYYQKCTTSCDHKTCEIINKKCLKTKSPHTVISSEYDNVLLYLCDGYDITDDGIVMIKQLCYGNLNSQLYSIITRTVKKLKIITDNIAIYNYLMEKLEQM